MKRLVAGVLCAAIVVTAPGLLPYAAAAEIINASPSSAARPVQIGTSQLNVLKGVGSLPVVPGALGFDPTQRTIPEIPNLAAPASGTVDPVAQTAGPSAALIQPSAAEAKQGPVAPVVKAVEPGLQAIAKPGASGETSARSGDEVTTILQGGSASASTDGAVEEPAELEMPIALDARVGRQSEGVSLRVGRDDPLLEFL